MSNLSIFISLPIGILGFLFLFWRRLKEDYPSNQIFSFGFTVIGLTVLGFLVGNFLSYNFKLTNSIFTSKGMWFWFAFIFASIAFEISYIKIKLRFFETLEAAGLGFIFFIFSIFLVNAIQSINLLLLLVSMTLLGLIVLFFILDARYKRFSWYKSGKIGFAGLSILGIFFLLRSVVALIDPSMLSFIGKLDAIIDCLVAFAFFITLFNLSGI